ncbi:MAG: hypothetical protein JWQ38_969 [Flavipsychrobacter sp.]|nr:hypothetical protein [Flavipsychrobacter sp.]
MKRYLFALLLLSFLTWGNTCSAQVADSAKLVRSLTRCWRVISHEVSPIYGLDDEDIKRYSKQNVCFTRDSVRMFSNTLYTPTYSIKKVNAEEYATTNFECSKNKLAILTDTVYELTISSVTKPSPTGAIYKMTDVLAFDDDFIYAVVDGVIFKLFAADRKVESKGAR